MYLYRDGEMELVLVEPRLAGELYALVDRNRDSLREWLGWVDATRGPSDVREFIESELRAFAGGTSLGTFLIRAEGRIVGNVGYGHTIGHARRTEIGYWLGAEARGQGLMTKACRVLIDHAFGPLGLNKVEIHCATGNHRSCAIPQRLGFRHEGTIRDAEWLYDHFVDHNVFGLLRREWAAGDAG